MMKKLVVLFALLFAAPAHAGVSCSVPFNLQNNTTADATQVMANYNALISCLGNAAAAGINSDITTLSALTTPLTPSQGGTATYLGATSTGTANAQVVAVTTPTTFSLQIGNSINFVAGFTNTGPMQINVGSTGLTNVFRRTQLGLSALVGGEIIAGHNVTLYFDGTRFQLVSAGIVMVGQMMDWAGSTAPAGWAIMDGSCQLRAGVFADLFSLIGTTYDPTGLTCDGSHFAMPDLRGRFQAGIDPTGLRITNAGGGCPGTVLGQGCGSQVRVIQTANLPVYTPTGSVAGTVTLTPSGSISQITPAGSISQITPAGSISQITPAGSVSGSVTFTPTGSNSVSGDGTNIAINDSGHLHGHGISGFTTANFSTSAGGTSLVTGITIGNTDSATTGVTVAANTAASHLSSAFTGNSQSPAISASFTGTPVTPTFTGNAVTPTFTGTPVTPTFTGNAQSPAISATFTGDPVGSATGMFTLPPLQIVNKIIKY